MGWTMGTTSMPISAHCYVVDKETFINNYFTSAYWMKQKGSAELLNQNTFFLLFRRNLVRPKAS